MSEEIEVFGHCRNCGKGFRMDDKGSLEYAEHKKQCVKGQMIVVNMNEYAALKSEIDRLKSENSTLEKLVKNNEELYLLVKSREQLIFDLAQDTIKDPNTGVTFHKYAELSKVLAAIESEAKEKV